MIRLHGEEFFDLNTRTQTWMNRKTMLRLIVRTMEKRKPAKMVGRKTPDTGAKDAGFRRDEWDLEHRRYTGTEDLNGVRQVGSYHYRSLLRNGINDLSPTLGRSASVSKPRRVRSHMETFR